VESAEADVVFAGRPRAGRSPNPICSVIIYASARGRVCGHVLMLEEVGEAMYRIDRSLFHITSNAEIRRVSGVMLGRCSNITPNEPDFGILDGSISRSHHTARVKTHAAGTRYGRCRKF
jgi:hypothetical protein